MSKSSLTDTHTKPSNKSVFQRSQEIADQAAAGGPGHRTATSFLPANPSQNHEVAFALGDVLTAMKGAVSLGATQSELEDLIHQAVPIEPAPYVFA